jgi:hypothetical protein
MSIFPWQTITERADRLACQSSPFLPCRPDMSRSEFLRWKQHYPVVHLVLGKIRPQKEIWENAACLVDPDSPSELKDVLKKLITDEFHRNIMSCRATKAAHAYTSSRFAEQYLATYRLLLQKPLVKAEVKVMV